MLAERIKLTKVEDLKLIKEINFKETDFVELVIKSNKLDDTVTIFKDEDLSYVFMSSNIYYDSLDLELLNKLVLTLSKVLKERM